jgi:peroxiredoxin
MNRKLFIVTLSLTCIPFVNCFNQSDIDILSKTISKLNSLKTIEYLATNHLTEKSFGQNRVDSAICFFDFTSRNKTLGTRFHLADPGKETIFTGSKMISIDKGEKLIIYEDNPTYNHLNSNMFIKNSFYELKMLLPELLNNPSVKWTRQNDTIFNEVSNFNFKISIINGGISYGKVVVNNGITSHHNIYISKATYLPTYFCTFFYGDMGQFSTTFSRINLQAERSDTIWNYDKYSQGYLVMSLEEQRSGRKSTGFVSLGDKAPAWSLPIVASKDSVRLAELKGSLVLLEFFFPGCAYCIPAATGMNSIMKTYSSKGLKVYGIEFSKTNDIGLETHLKKNNYLYPVLHTGGTVAKRYGVTGAPTIFLIDKKGNVIYKSVGFNGIDEIAAVIETNQ